MSAPPAEQQAPPRPGLPPGSRLPGLLQSLPLLRDPLGWVERNRDRHGELWQVRFNENCQVIPGARQSGDIEIEGNGKLRHVWLEE